MLRLIGFVLVGIGIADLVLYFFVDGNYGFIPYWITIGGDDYTTYAVILAGWVLTSIK